MASADTPLQPCCHPFRCKAGLPQVRVALLHHTTAASTPLALDHKNFAIECPLALTSHALYAVRVPRLVIYAPRFLPTLGYPHAVALHFIRCDQLMVGLAPTGVRPCWAHIRSGPRKYARALRIPRVHHAGGALLSVMRKKKAVFALARLPKNVVFN